LRKSDFKQDSFYEMAASAEEVTQPAIYKKSPLKSSDNESIVEKSTSIGGLVADQDPFAEENQLDPNFEGSGELTLDDILNQTIEDLSAVGQPLSLSDHEEDESVTPVGTPLRSNLEPTPTPITSAPNNVDSVGKNTGQNQTPIKADQLVELLQTQTLDETNGFTPKVKAHQEFDPLIPKDWMMSFDSPSVPRSDSVPTYPTVPSLLDALEPVASPRSVVKFNQRDLDNVKQELEEKVILIDLA
jgi:hypothetical protein